MTYYTRHEIVELLELDEVFLVSLEREEIVVRDAPPEAEGEFSERMLERARVAQNLVRDLEVNLPGVAVIVRLRDKRVARMIAVNPSVAFGQAYIDGRVTVDGDLWNLMELASRNKKQLLGDRRLILPLALRSFIRKLQHHNPPRLSRRNAPSFSPEETHRAIRKWPVPVRIWRVRRRNLG